MPNDFNILIVTWEHNHTRNNNDNRLTPQPYALPNQLNKISVSHKNSSDNWKCGPFFHACLVLLTNCYRFHHISHFGIVHTLNDIILTKKDNKVHYNKNLTITIKCCQNSSIISVVMWRNNVQYAAVAHRDNSMKPMWLIEVRDERVRMRFSMHCMHVHAPNKFHFVNNNQLKSIDQLHFIVIRRLLDNFREKGTDEILVVSLETNFVIGLLSLPSFQCASSIFAHVKNSCEWKSSFVSEILLNKKLLRISEVFQSTVI